MRSLLSNISGSSFKIFLAASEFETIGPCEILTRRAINFVNTGVKTVEKALSKSDKIVKEVLTVSCEELRQHLSTFVAIDGISSFKSLIFPLEIANLIELRKDFSFPLNSNFLRFSGGF